MPRLALLSIFALATLLATAPVALACPGCRDALASSLNPNICPWDSNQSDTGAAYSYSVLFMLGMFLTLLLGFGGAFAWKAWFAAPPATAAIASASGPAAAPTLEPGLS